MEMCRSPLHAAWVDSLFLFRGLMVAIWFVICGQIFDGGGPGEDAVV